MTILLLRFVRQKKNVEFRNDFVIRLKSDLMKFVYFYKVLCNLVGGESYLMD